MKREAPPQYQTGGFASAMRSHELSVDDFEEMPEAAALGAGASAVVRAMRRRSDGVIVAVKEFDATKGGNRREFMQRELQVMVRRAMVDDDGTVPPIGNESDDNTSMSTCVVDIHGYIPMPLGGGKLIMECMEGSLGDFPAMPEAICLGVAAQMLVGLHYAHSTLNFIHRDLKPSNFLFRDGRVKLSDFGVALLLGYPDGVTREFAGSLMFFSPERLRGDYYGFSADIWAFGLTIAQLALGHHPFKEYIEAADCSTTEARFWRMAELLRIDDEGDPSISTASTDCVDDVLSLHAGPRTRTEIALADAGLSEPFRLLVLRCLAQKPEHRPPCSHLFADELWRGAASGRQVETWLRNNSKK